MSDTSERLPRGGAPSRPVISEGASGLTTLSNIWATRLIQSRGNLYWSANGQTLDGDQSMIYRASKSNQPGEEIGLYAETFGGQPPFRALTFANVDGEFYGYFVANYQDSPADPAVSQIKSIPLGAVTNSGQANVLLGGTSDPAPAVIGDGDLVTDGSVLCWADSEGIRSMPIGGGTVTPLVTGTGFARLSVLGRTLYYVDGNAILSVPTGGGTPSFVLGTRLFPITALHVLEAQLSVALAERPETPPPPPVPDVALVWGRADGAVFGMMRGETTTYRQPTADTTVVSVYSTGSRVLWSDFYTAPSGVEVGCAVLMWYGGTTTTLYHSDAAIQIIDVLADEDAVYWTTNFVAKYTF